MQIFFNIVVRSHTPQIVLTFIVLTNFSSTSPFLLEKLIPINAIWLKLYRLTKYILHSNTYIIKKKEKRKVLQSLHAYDCFYQIYYVVIKLSRHYVFKCFVMTLGTHVFKCFVMTLGTHYVFKCFVMTLGTLYVFINVI